MFRVQFTPAKIATRRAYLILGWMTPMVELVGHQDQWAPKGPLGRTLKRTF